MMDAPACLGDALAGFGAASAAGLGVGSAAGSAAAGIGGEVTGEETAAVKSAPRAPLPTEKPFTAGAGLDT